MEKTDDELERIEGIGTAMATALRTAGIRTFAQLAAADDATKRAAIRAAGLKFAPSLVTWSRQAQLLADGDEAAFRDLTEKLIAGRDTTPGQAKKPLPTGTAQHDAQQHTAQQRDADDSAKADAQQHTAKQHDADDSAKADAQQLTTTRPAEPAGTRPEKPAAGRDVEPVR